MGDAKSNIDTRNFKRIKTGLVVKFFCVFVVVYGSLTALWPVVGPSYSKFYRTGASVLFAKFGSNGVVQFHRSNNDLEDINIILCNKEQIDTDSKTIAGYQVPHSSRYHGYYCTVLLIALIAATPLPPKRRGLAVLWSMILIHAFIASKMLILILNPFSTEPLCLFELSPFFEQILAVATKVFVTYITPSFTVSVFIWILVSFRREDWLKILNVRKE